MTDEFMLPRLGGMYLRDALQGFIGDMAEKDGRHQVQVKFPHDTVDTYKTTFGQDAFKESFSNRMPLMCWQHDMRDPIGHAVKAQATRSANELVGQFSDFNAVPNALRAYSQIGDGTITDFSFGFRQPRFEKHKRYPGVRNIAKAQMMEFSPVSIGSIPGAVVTGLREDDLIMEYSAEEIRGLVEAQIITPEQGREMLLRCNPDLADMFRVEHVTTTSSNVTNVDYTADFEEMETRDDDAVPVPENLGAQDIVDILPDSWRSALMGYTLHVVPEDLAVRFGAEAEGVREADLSGATEIADAMNAACQTAEDYLREEKVEELPENVQQAIALFRAAGESTGPLLEVIGERAGTLGDSQTRPSTGTYTEPTDPAGSEDMGLHEVSCLECGGSGQVQSGAICPKCAGSGVEAVVRALDGVAQPDGTTRCPKCKGRGVLANEDLCPVCEGKGYLPDVEGLTGEPNARSEGEMDYRFVSEADRKDMAKTGVAMPNGDFPIPDKGHLQSALGHLATYNGDKAAAAAHIKKRAKALGVELSDDDLATRSAAKTHEGDMIPGETNDTVDGPSPDPADVAAMHLNRISRRKGSKRITDETTDLDPDGDGDDDTEDGGKAGMATADLADDTHAEARKGGSAPRMVK
jgi:HK97 family phage prohead protease